MGELSMASKIRKLEKRLTKKLGQSMERGYREISGVGAENADWAMTMTGEDSDLWQNAWALTSRARDLFRTNPAFQKYRETLWAGVFGADGTMLRMEIKEKEDRVVYSADEKTHLMLHEKRKQRVLDYANGKSGVTLNREQIYRAFHLAEGMDRAKRDDVLRGKATVVVGQPDIYANTLIEEAWIEWQRARYCDMRQKRPYNMLRQLRLINAVRDGDFFIRKISRPSLNKFGFGLQLISAEWCDRWLNTTLGNGNVVIMGIEYQMTPEGVGPVVAYYFIKRQPMDWQFSIPGAFNFSNGDLHVRIDAREIIHYCRPVDADSTRPAPWICAAIPQARQLSQYEIAEVIAARKEACTTGFLWSDVNPDGGENTTPIDPRVGVPEVAMRSTNMLIGLPFGVKYQANNPTHPTMNYPGFRKGQGQSIAAAMPGGDYNTLFNDLESINFSAGRLGRLDKKDTIVLIQKWDEQIAERDIFESWLEMALITGAIPLPLGKFNKFNKPVFQGPRSEDVDEVKAVNAAALRVANKFRSRTRECADNSEYFDKIAFEIAEEEMLLDELGLSTGLTVENQPTPAAATDETEGAPPAASVNPPKSNGNGKVLDLSRV